MRRHILLVVAVTLIVNLSGWAQYFGLPALDPALEFRTLDTEHFRIHFHQDLEGVAREVALIAEDAYSVLKEEFGAAPDRLDLMLADPFDFSNGYANPFFGHIGVFASQIRLSDWSNVRLTSWWEMVVFHEIVHAIELDRTEGLSKTVRELFGKVALPSMWKPWAFIEGLAVYMKYKHLGESRLNDARTRAVIRQMVLDGAFPEFDELRQFYNRTTWPPGGFLIYNFSAWFMLYIETVHGDEALRRIVEVNAGQWENAVGPVGVADFDRVVREALDVGLEALYAGFRSWLRAEFVPEIERLEQAGVSRGLRLTEFGWTTDAPAWSPDGEWIAYTHQGAVRQGLRLMRPDGSDDKELVRGNAAHPVWTPDGRGLIYARLDHHGPHYIISDLYRYDVHAGQEMRLTWGERAYFAQVSPDGRFVYYGAALGRDGSTALRRLDLVTRETSTVVAFPGASLHSFALCPEGERAALVLWRRGGYQDLYMLELAGGELHALTQDKNEAADPVWTSDGGYILFSADPDRISNVFAYSVDDDAFFQVTRTMTFAGAPALDPDDAVMVYVGYGSGGYDLYRMPLDRALWEAVSFEEGQVPDWEGYPETDHPVQAYRPIEHLLPAFWLPMPIPGGLGVALAGQDPLGKHTYYGMVGWDWEVGQPTYEVGYGLRERFPVEISLAAGRWGSRQSIDLSIPLALGLAGGRWVDLAYHARRTPDMPVDHTLSMVLRVRESIAQDLGLRHTSLSLRGSTTFSGAARHHRVDGSWQEAVRLPVEGAHWLTVGVEAAWTDADSARYHISLGGTEGRFALRGLPTGVLSGPQALRGAAAYRFPLVSIHQNLGHRPLFFENLSGRVLLEAGVGHGWYRLAGEDHLLYCMTDFGESGTKEDVSRHFGFDAEAIAEEIGGRL